MVWRRRRRRGAEASLGAGVSLAFKFPDPEGKLDTAYDDFRAFLAAGQIRTDGKYGISTELAPTSCFEEYRVIVAADRCRVLANDTEGIRRALVRVEDMVRGSGGPFLPLGETRREALHQDQGLKMFFRPDKASPAEPRRADGRGELLPRRVPEPAGA